MFVFFTEFLFWAANVDNFQSNTRFKTKIDQLFSVNTKWQIFSLRK